MELACHLQSQCSSPRKMLQDSQLPIQCEHPISTWIHRGINQKEITLCFHWKKNLVHDLKVILSSGLFIIDVPLEICDCPFIGSTKRHSVEHWNQTSTKFWRDRLWIDAYRGLCEILKRERNVCLQSNLWKENSKGNRKLCTVVFILNSVLKLYFLKHQQNNIQLCTFCLTYFWKTGLTVSMC